MILLQKSANRVVYNNFPWPESATTKQRAAVEAKAQAVLDARAQFMDTGARPSGRFNART